MHLLLLLFLGAAPRTESGVYAPEPDAAAVTAPATIRAPWCFRQGIHWSPPAPWRVAQVADQDRALLAGIQARVVQSRGERAIPVDCIAVRGDFDGDARADLAVMTVDRSGRRAALWLVLSTPSPISEAPVLVFPRTPTGNGGIITSPIVLKPRGEDVSQETWNAPASLVRHDAVDLWHGVDGEGHHDYFSGKITCETYFYVSGGALKKVDVCDS